MTQTEGTPSHGHHRGRVVGVWLTAVAGIVSIPAVVVLALTGHTEQAAAVGVIGGAMCAAGGIQVTVHIRR